MVQREVIEPRRTRAVAVGVGVAVLIAVLGLLWAKWVPYAGKAIAAGTGHPWDGGDILRTGGVQPGDAPSWAAAWSFTVAYGAAIWKALVVALLIGAAVPVLLPPSWPRRLMGGGGRFRDAVVGTVSGLPSMMCTCCTAPVATSLRRSGASTSGAVAYWLANPLLNPAVLIFLAFLAPWQWTATRIVAGIAVILVAATLAARAGPRPVPETDPAPEPAYAPGVLPYLKALGRLALFLIPEYAVVVLLLGAFRGWLLPLVDGAHTGPLIVVAAAVIGTLLVIPTAGEIPILLALSTLGLSGGVIGALLVTLPAVSLPGIAMVVRSFGTRATAVTAGITVVGGVLAGAVLAYA